MLWLRLLSVSLTLLPMSGCLGDLATEAELDKRIAALDVSDGALADAATETTDAQGDVTPADADLPDAATTDADLPDVATTDTTSDVCPGADGCECAADSECHSGACIPTPQGVQCAATCDGTCEAGATCKSVPLKAGGTTMICEPNWLTLCDPCDTSEDCHHSGDPTAACIGPTALGSYCGASCTATGDCPTGYACEEAQTVEGGTSKQCRRLPSGSDPQGEPGACPCSKLASQLQRSTGCTRGAGAELGPDAGACKGRRACGLSGLGTCDAPQPQAEVCDGNDNDCDNFVDEKTCDDADPCTADACSIPEGCTHTALSAGVCDDGNPCTLNDKCQNGKCAPGGAKPCPTGPCSLAQCDPLTGACSMTDRDDGTQCNPGDACIQAAVCNSGKCKGNVVTCSDGLPCTSDWCDPVEGCLAQPGAGQCSDGNACTGPDKCSEGKCSGLPLVCDDGQQCTADSCNPATGCVYALIVGACDDGNSCTSGDTCKSGTCAPGANSCQCQVTADCATLEDGDLCNGTLFCDANKKCANLPGSVKTCAPVLNPCLTNKCVPATGKCLAAPNADGTSCDADGSACTVNDACAKGVCTAGTAKGCDDGNTCTADSCDPQNGCVNLPVTGACTDGNACTTGDQCQGGKCVTSGAVSCTAKPCYTASCNVGTGTCDYVQADVACEDGKVCTGPDKCQGGQCLAGPMSCVAASKCATASCGSIGECVQIKLDCDDSNPCTKDDCAPSTGCLHPPVTDATPCGLGQFCWTGKCVSPWAKAIALGGDSGCALRVDGSVTCWGANSKGQLGNGSNQPTNAPVAIPAPFTATSLRGGDAHMSALTSGGTGAASWGSNKYGQLGIGTLKDVNKPTAVALSLGGGVAFLSLAAGERHTCAVVSQGKVACWGDNSMGQLGTATGDPVTTPTLTKVVDTKLIHAGSFHSCAVVQGASEIQGHLVCWGSNAKGQLGFATADDWGGPKSVPGSLGASDVAGGLEHTCGLVGTVNRAVICFGGNSRGQLGVSGDGGVGGPMVAVQGLALPEKLTAGDEHSCAVVAMGKVMCWGRNSEGELGNGGSADSHTPVQVSNLSGAIAISAGARHTCALRLDGSVWCWGDNSSGQLGAGTTSNAEYVPVQVVGSAPK
jgi:alpha-tubulin suppressor-like RCC1 family protein